MRKLLMSILFVGILFVMASCSFGDNDDTSGGIDSNDDNQSEENSINLFHPSDIPTMDSSHAHDIGGLTALNNTNEGLYRGDENHEPQLALAEEHNINDDGTVHTFTLRDSTWSNGEKVTAHDFEYAWKRTFEVAGHYSDMFVTANVANAQAILDEEKEPDELGVKAKDEDTLEVTLESPSPLFKQLLTFPTFFPLYESFVEEQGEQYGTEADKLLFNGAFVLDSWEHDQGWVFKKNKDYWDADAVEIDEINVNVIKETTTLVNLWDTGELDRIELSSSFVDEYKNDDSFLEEEKALVIFLRMNHNIDGLQNVNIRKAIDMSLNKKSLADVILNDGSLALNGLVPSKFAFSPDGKDFREVNGAFNEGTLEDAQELWEKGLSDIGKDNLDVKLTVSEDDTYLKISEYVKDQLETNLDGISIEIKKVPFEARLEQTSELDYDIVIDNWGPDYSDPLTYLDEWTTDNPSGYSNEKYDEIIGKIKKELNVGKRFDMMLEAEKILLDEMTISPLIQEADSVLMKQNIKGMVRHPSSPEFDYKWTSVE